MPVPRLNGYVKLNRNLLDWRWYRDANTIRVFLHLLLSANFKDQPFENIIVRRGEVATSYGAIAEALHISARQARTAVTHLKVSSTVSVKQYSKFQVISIISWDLYQCAVSGTEAVKSQAEVSQKSTNEECKESKKDSMPPRRTRFTPPTVEEVKAYCAERGDHVDADRFVDFYTANGWTQGRGKPIKDWKACVRTWERSDREEQKAEGTSAYEHEL